MPSVRPDELLEAIGLEGPVRVSRLEGRRHFYVLFRLAGKQFHRSTGTDDRSAARLAAARIFADVVAEQSQPKLQPTSSDRVATDLAEIKQLLLRQSTAGGSSALPPPLTGPKHPLDEAHKAFLAARKPHVSDHQLTNLTRRGEDFLRFASIQQLNFVEDIEPGHLTAWLAGRDLSAKSKRNYLGDVSAFFTWCTMSPQCWISRNPVSLVQRERVRRSAPKLMRIDQVQQLFAYLEAERPHYVAYYALAVFAGIRWSTEGSEMTRLADEVKEHGWKHVMSETGIRILQSKNDDQRQAPLPQNLKRWLTAYPNLKIPTRDEHDTIRKKFGIPGNAARHTAITAFVIRTGNISQACYYFSTSEAMIRTNYQGFMTREEVEQFDAIVPR